MSSAWETRFRLSAGPDIGYPPHLFTADFRATNPPISLKIMAFTRTPGPDLKCLLGPAESMSGSKGIEFLGRYLYGAGAQEMGSPGRRYIVVSPIGDQQQGPGELVLGF